MRRVLLIVPKSLLGQWQTELYTLFGIEAREGHPDPEAFAGSGVFLVHREFAGGLKGASLLKSVDPFDLVVIDEAHEVFAGVYKRFDKDGNYDERSKDAVAAGRVRELVKIGGMPVLLLTATPIQNSLTELWGLAQYVEPSGTLFGKLPTFRELFCESSDRAVVPAQAPELRRRLRTILQRTLRRQAQEFLEVPFVERQAKLVEYAMSPDERALYDDVTAWLMQPHLCAFRGSQRQLLLIAFHRRMASSLRALSSSLERVAERLREQLRRGGGDSSGDRPFLAEFARDLEEELPEPTGTASAPSAPPTSVERVRAELARVEGFAQRAASLPKIDGKARCLLDALRIVRDRGARGDGTGRAVIFTESLTTQDYLRDLLVEDGFDDDEITLFRGQNDSSRARAALERWQDEVGRAIPPGNQPSRDVALRLALVHEFRERSKVFISTEAGAKGLNLQFCETLVNYDLPWNPQRIEQRIGRIHRYGQRLGVTVMSFLARENEAQKLTFEILSQKLELFGKVLDASDAVLHEPRTGAAAPESLVSAIGIDFEAQLRRIYEQARSIDEVTQELRALRASMDAKRQEFDTQQTRAAGLVETRLDGSVRQIFRRYQEDLPEGLRQLDGDLDRLLRGFLEALDVRFDRSEAPGRVVYRIARSAVLPEGYRDGPEVVIGDARDLREGDVLHLGHPLLHAAVEEARRATQSVFTVELVAETGAPRAALAPLVGRRGRLVVTKIAYRGIEPVDHLLTTALLEGEVMPLDRATTELLLRFTPRDVRDVTAHLAVDIRAFDEATEEAVLADETTTTAGDHERFERMLEQLDRYVEDQLLVLRRKRSDLEQRIDEAEKRKDRTVTPSARTVEDRAIVSMRSDHQRLLARIEQLEEGGDQDYQQWRERLHERRFRKPEVAQILDIDFTVADGGVGC
ncbi:MAG: hypothetical protein HYU41_22285 [Candidatus Rokubacteria bacterium]|nr:hypothetical protein [Candidatus Rokubacteria bacterium]